MDNDPRAGYENDLENRVVYRRIESHIEELRIDEAWTKKRFRLGFLISLSFIAGEQQLDLVVIFPFHYVLWLQEYFFLFSPT